jgi:hypothetical protein
MLSGMDRHRRFARAEDKLARLSKQGLDMVAFWSVRSCAGRCGTPGCGPVLLHH